ncbi:galactokinase [Verrucomicrobiaceae bacterium N1E253]|uniref:Galactokinase n=1 Tax=Oceaniferula marina TaxID=2748318 RepID=A0A851GAJ3_9BACT|nr:galactokinase [Oceaniferula marina]NWK53992.1 galactokinase [Oceaniferula marina]
MNTLIEKAKDGFTSTFGKEPTVIAAAPGRVNLIGEHIDYCDGFVMPFALEQNFVIAAAPNGTTTARFGDAKVEGIIEIDVAGEITESTPKWSNYPRGVMHYFREEAGCTIPGFDAYIISNVPSGGGLSSSAAFELSVATMLEGITGEKLNTKTKALLCQKAEHVFAHCPCGIMDQFASAFGETDRLVMIDCQSGEPTLVPFENPDLTVIVANTCVEHELSDGGYASRRKATEDGLKIIGKNSWRDVSMSDVDAAKDTMGDVVYRRGHHVVGEIQRTIDAAAALKANDFDTLGSLMYASHASLRDDFEVSCEELDIMVDIARSMGKEGGVIGARMTGGGFGGSTVTLCESDKADDIVAAMTEQYKEQTGIDPEIFTSRPSKGARLI